MPRRPDLRRARRPDRTEPLALLYGLHAVRAALDNPRRVPRRLLVTRNAADRLGLEGKPAPCPVELATPEAIAARLAPGAVHQGVLLEAEPLPEIGLEDLGAARLVLALDQVTDPQNVGAVLRSAAAFAADAVVTTARHAPEATGALAKAASGGLEHVPLVTVVNLARALDELGAQGFLRIGLDSEGYAALEALVAPQPLVLVLGAEDKGLRRLTRERCGGLARLDMPGPIKSLNVSNAAALALYVASRALGSADRGQAQRQ